MTDQLISLKTAKLAKEKGFPQAPSKEDVIRQSGDLNFLTYYPDGIIRGFWFNPYDYVKETASAPTQSLLQKWIREVHNIHIFIGRRINVKKWDSHAYSLSLSAKEYVKERTMEKFRQQSLFDTYEEALEYGLQEALNLI